MAVAFLGHRPGEGGRAGRGPVARAPMVKLRCKLRRMQVWRQGYSVVQLIAGARAGRVRTGIGGTEMLRCIWFG